MKQYDKAIADSTKAIEINPQLAEAYSNRGLTYALLENWEQAYKDLKKAANLFYKQGNNEEYQQALRSIEEIKAAQAK